MAVQRIVSSHIVDDYIYDGNCPKCGKEQSNIRVDCVDVLCTDCILECVQNEITNGDVHIGSIVINYKIIDARSDSVELTILSPDLQLYTYKTTIFPRSIKKSSISKLYYIADDQCDVECKDEIVNKYQLFIKKIIDSFKFK